MQAKAPSPILTTLLGIVMFARLLQPKKAVSPIVVTLPGMAILVKLSHPKKALSSIVTMPSESVTPVRLLLREKAHLSILVTLLLSMLWGITMFPPSPVYPDMPTVLPWST